MRKQIQRYGNTLVMKFTKEEQMLFDIKEGQVYDVELVMLSKKQLAEKKK